MASINSLRNIIKKLKKEEIRSLINFIKYNQGHKNSLPLKSIQLINLLLSEKNYSTSDLQHRLYDKQSYAAFSKLIKRLKDKIYEVMLFNSNLDKSISAERNRIIFNLRKKLIQSEIMFVRGINDELEAFQNKVIDSAKKYEVYDSLLEALYAKQRYLGFRFGSQSYNKLGKEIDFYEESRAASIKAREIFTGITTKINFSTTIEDFLAELLNAIEILEGFYSNTQSATIGYYYLFLKVEKHQYQNHLQEAQITLEELLKLIKYNPAIYTDNRMGTALINIGINELLRFNFNNSIVSIQEAIPFFKNVELNIQFAKEIEFYALFYLSEIDVANQLMEELYQSTRNLNTPFLYSKRCFLLASLKTLRGEFSKSIDLLNEVSDIEKDKEGWNLSKRILLIINKIETQELEYVDLQVQNLQRHVKRTLKTKSIRKRYILILRILIKLINEQFNFEKVYHKRRRYFELLESTDNEYGWKIKSPELIIFHEWFKSKAEQRPYNHLASIELAKERYLAEFRQLQSAK